MLSDLIDRKPLNFRTHADVASALRVACAENSDLATFHELGSSEEGRPLYGVVLGHGPRTVSLIAGNHSDEPVGPETLRTFILEGLKQHEALRDIFARFRFVIVPHTNPDGEARNREWMEQWPNAEDYFLHAFREPPGRDLEFGFPSMRQENRLVSAFLEEHAPFVLHMSLHGMGVAEGGMLLIERHWPARTQPLRDAFAGAVRAAGLRLHDHNRKGEKGFFYIEPGFWTTPEGAAMRAFFQAQGDETMAARFHDSSMEFVRRLGGDPLCLVTELPLFVLSRAYDHTPGVPALYLAFKARLPEWKLRLQNGASIADELAAFGLAPLDLTTAVRLQLTALEEGLKCVG